MSWLQTADIAVFRFLNQKLNNPVLDALMPLFSSNAWFIPGVILLGLGLVWKGGTRGRLFVLMLALTLAVGDTFVINALKKTVARPRPVFSLTDVILSPAVGKGGSASMPSSHASTWCAAALVAFVYYPRTRFVMVPLALIVCFSRVYLGVHYPGDVIVGAILGAGYAATLLWSFNAIWRWAGPRWFPLWWRTVPTLIIRSRSPAAESSELEHPATPALADRAQANRQFLYLGYVVIVLVLLLRLFYAASSKIELSEDEAYQWLWSKHLALSYYSKPPGIAWLHFLGTSLWGDVPFGIRFLPPVMAALLGVVTLRFFARQVNACAAFFLLLIVNCTPLPDAGSTLLTVDAPLVFFWTAAMVAGWRAVQPDATTRSWLWVGLWTGLAFLFKYTALCLVGCWALWFLLWPPARVHLKKPGPWLALLVVLLCALPVLVWNSQNGWITAQHLSENAKLEKKWLPTLKYFGDFFFTEAGLLHPIFFGATLWAMVAFWKRSKQNPLQQYFFAMGAPVFLGYALFTLHSRVQPNWIAPAVLPLFCLMVAYWDQRYREGVHAVKGWLFAGLILGGALTIIAHDTDLTYRLTKVWLPVKMDPLRRVRAIEPMVGEVEKARQQLLGEGKEVFLIGNHYGITSQISFYLPAAHAGLPHQPLVYPRETATPKNQFFFWPEYRYTEHRQGQNAIFVALNGDSGKPPPELVNQFESVTDLGLREIKRGKRVLHVIQLYACRNLH